MKRFTPYEDNFLKDNYLTMSVSAMARYLHRALTSIQFRLPILDITIPEEIKNKFQKQARFKKGRKSPNKGKKQREFCTREHIKKLTKARFKKGHLNINKKNTYERTLRLHVNGSLYYWIKVSADKWEMYHLWLWKKSGRTIPESHVVTFKNGDTLKPYLNNLECITKAELLKRNQLKKKVEREKYSRVKKRLIATRSKIKNHISIKKDSRKKEVERIKKERSEIIFRVPDTSNLKPVRIDHKTVIYIKPGADVEKIKGQYSSINKIAS